MCGRYTLFTDFESLLERFDIEYSMEEDLFIPSYNIAPSQQVVSIINDGKKNRLGKLRWGLIPGWAKDEKVSYKMINARSETVEQKPSFCNAFTKRRCLIPMDSFFEWKKHDSSKIPMRIKLKTDEVFAVAGLWESWKSPEGKTIHSCTILTTEANSLVSDIHDRMPVILRPEDEKVWLNTELQEKETLKRLLVPYDASVMEAYAVSSEVNSPKNNHEGLLNSL
ncbi:SOS response-associated peptidase [Psychrobacillus lasiicapitis]|uniref:Abasic site processing protein n=1 Tax=Psychrobacillus lasiicapitis TaxID=1636719 RepID=A0A544SWJ6_9BACI|nr:SOS response-associated peptidase [Psychrobacillus lasiicapitis]TQR09580.1 SOS response-associated peptidase [Psychrobacillus lasiicapitis]GGA29263.1 putative SOS response-associated peptidase YoqW [Psychrobacillus lasiicapitis]